MEKLKVWLGLLVLGGLVAAGPAWTADKAVANLNLEVSADFDYDFNATQQPESCTAAALIPKQGNAVCTQAAKVEYDFFPKDRFDILARYNFFQNFHPQVSPVDTMMQTWTLSPSYSFGARRAKPNHPERGGRLKLEWNVRNKRIVWGSPGGGWLPQPPAGGSYPRGNTMV